MNRHYTVFMTDTGMDEATMRIAAAYYHDVTGTEPWSYDYVSNALPHCVPSCKELLIPARMRLLGDYEIAIPAVDDHLDNVDVETTVDYGDIQATDGQVCTVKSFEYTASSITLEVVVVS